MTRYLIVLGFVVLMMALFWPTLRKLGLGRLPGEIVVKRKSGASFYLPLATCLLLSLVLSLIFWVANR